MPPKSKKAQKAAAQSQTQTPTPPPTNGKSSPTNPDEQSLADPDRSCTGVLASNARSRDVLIEQFSLYYHGRLLIDNATIELNFGRRYGLIGQNGSGKSTFLKCLAAREVPIPDHIDIHLLSKEAEPSELQCVPFVIAEAQKEVARLEAEAERLVVEEDAADDPILMDVYERIESLDPATFESRAATILHGLGFTQKQMEKKTKDLSGGWRMRVALAKALFIRPTMLLLDEPTNHLDLEACVWLEEFLKTYNRILVVVSHSQDFLNNVCTETIHLTHLRQLNYYGGNYDTFIRTKEENEVNTNKAYEKQQADIEKIERFAAAAGTYKNLVRQAKSKLKIIEKMDKIEKVEGPRLYKLRFEDVDKLPPPVLSFDQVDFSYSGKPEDLIYRKLDLAVDMDSRIALVGPNGAGKSTLLKLMSGELVPNAGRVSRHAKLKLAKYSQHSAEVLNPDVTPISYLCAKFKDEHGEDLQAWRSILGRYGLTGTHQLSNISTLSDGLKSRLVFAEICLSRPDIILLDEPTNHLDMESIDALADAINDWSGGIVLVSHDFRLISQVAEQILLCEKGTVKPWEGSIEMYKERLRKNVKI